MQTTPLDALDAVALAAVRADLTALAGRLRDDSAAVRDHVAVVAAAGDLAWRSPAADLYRAEIGERASQVRSAAVVLDDLATAVGRLSRQVGT